MKTIFLCLMLIFGLLAFSQTPTLKEFKKILYKHSFDSVETILRQKGYWFEKSENVTEFNGKFTRYYFKRTDESINANEQVVVYKKQNDPLSPFFDKIIYGTYNEKSFYSIKSDLPDGYSNTSEQNLDGCLKRKYSNGTFISFNFNICQTGGNADLTLYLFVVYFDF